MTQQFDFSNIILKYKLWSGKMTEQLKVLEAEPEDLIEIFGNHMVKGENQLI